MVSSTTLAEDRAPRHLPGVQVGAQQLGVVVEHLLEVRHEPDGVDAVAVKAAAELVVDAAVRHLLQRQLGHEKTLDVAGAQVLREREVERHGLRELGLAAKAAVLVVEMLAHAVQRLVEGFHAQLAAVGRQRGAAAQHGGEALGLAVDLVAAAAVGVGHGAQHLLEAGHAVARLLGIVGAAVEGLAVGQQPDAHGPAALTGHGLHGVHVDGVEIGAFLAVDLDVDKELVHQRRGLFILEALVLHDVAPVARAVADGEENGLVLGAGAGQRLLAPGVPVDRVVGVLAQVGRGFVDQTVGMLVFAHAGFRPGNVLQRGPPPPSPPSAHPQMRWDLGQTGSTGSVD